MHRSTFRNGIIPHRIRSRHGEVYRIPPVCDPVFQPRRSQGLTTRLKFLRSGGNTSAWIACAPWGFTPSRAKLTVLFDLNLSYCATTRCNKPDRDGTKALRGKSSQYQRVLRRSSLTDRYGQAKKKLRRRFAPAPKPSRLLLLY